MAKNEPFEVRPHSVYRSPRFLTISDKRDCYIYDHKLFAESGPPERHERKFLPVREPENSRIGFHSPRDTSAKEEEETSAFFTGYRRGQLVGAIVIYDNV